MGTKVEFRALYGGASNTPLCSLLRINDFTLLLDCGWDDEYDVELLKPIEEVKDSIDAILISHPDPAHLGALPYLIGRAKLQAPIYVTVPIHKMGQMFMYDQFLSRQQSSDFDVFSLDDVDAAFSRMRQLKYQQQVKLTGKGQGMSLTAFAAGHLVGGAIWQVLTPDEEQIIYAVHWNHRKDRHLKRADLDGRFSRPAVLITDACSAMAPPLDVGRRDAEFFATITNTLRSEGNVLIPSDTAGRSLELALLLEQHWQRHRLPYTVVLLTPVAYSTLEFAKSQLEWMNQDISDAFNRSRTNPFEFRHVRVCHSKEKLWELPPGPRVVLASVPSLATSMSLQLLVDWAPNPNNLIVFPGQAAAGTRAAVLQQKPWGSRDAVPIQMQLGRRVPLEGEELREWQEKQRAQLMEAEPLAVQEDLEEALLASSPTNMAIGELQTRGSSGSQGRGLGSQVSSSLPAAELLKPKARDTFVDGFTVPEGSAAAMFPFNEEDTREWTEYGAVLRPGDFRKVRDQDDTMDDGSEDENEGEIPTRVVSSEVVVNVRAQVATFNFEGLSDAHSIRTVLTNIAPRHVIIAYGTLEARHALLTACTAQQEIMWQVHTAAEGETVDASSGSSSYRVSLSEELVEKLQFRSMGEYRLAWLNARIKEAAEEGVIPELIPAEDLGVNAQEGGIFIGDVKLSALKKALGEMGISADFYGGMLVCQSRIVVKSRGSGGQLTLEGPVCQDFYSIRDVIYSQYHMC